MDDNIKKEELEFVHDNDLIPILKKLGLDGAFVSGKINCAFCGDVMIRENLYSFFEDNGVKFSCNKDTCIKELEKRQ